jgi:hypothetical protein
MGYQEQHYEKPAGRAASASFRPRKNGSSAEKLKFAKN